MTIRPALTAGFLVVLAACQSAAPGPGPLAFSNEDRALPVMERIALAARECWFRSGDAAFRPYRMAPELASFTGRPRILIVPADAPNGRPLAVVQAEGEPARVDAFGPLMSEPVGTRITADIRRWAGGDSACT